MSPFITENRVAFQHGFHEISRVWDVPSFNRDWYAPDTPKHPKVPLHFGMEKTAFVSPLALRMEGSAFTLLHLPRHDDFSKRMLRRGIERQHSSDVHKDFSLRCIAPRCVKLAVRGRKYCLPHLPGDELCTRIIQESCYTDAFITGMTNGGVNTPDVDNLAAAATVGYLPVANVSNRPVLGSTSNLFLVNGTENDTKHQKRKSVRHACDSTDTRGLGISKVQGGGKRCQRDGCSKSPRGATSFCSAHGGGKRCQMASCDTSARGSSGYCKLHGGGVRCQKPNCTTSARGATGYCIAHGGGVRCQMDGCTKSAQGSTEYCVAHGGGVRCQVVGCSKSAQGSTKYCVAHGGGRRCKEVSCSKLAQGSQHGYCVGHGNGGKTCGEETCTRFAVGTTGYCKAHSSHFRR
mmetsp:Transcript_29107/g.55932  ORF Transcript_29107/g.55932 Transcript_29107/m.55932 type:complete len:405 (-) Transcript_29107:379-1593(-)